MTEKPSQPQPRSWLWESLTSIRLTIVVLLVLAAVAVVGTVVPQDQPPGQYLSRFGQGLGNLLVRGGFTSVYYSPWFLAPVSLLGLNILACLVHGLPRAIRRSRRRLTWEAALSLPERGRFTWAPGLNPVRLAPAIFTRELGRPHHQALPDKEVYFYERGRWRPLGPYLVHLALLFILAGGLIGKFAGVEGRLLLHEGEESSMFQLGPMAEQPLGYKVRLDRFQVQFYEQGGAPKEFRSDLTFFQDNKESIQATCKVNEPVTFGGYTLYQSSYGADTAGPIRLTVRRGESSRSLEAPFRSRVEVPEIGGQIIVVKVDGNLQGLGPAVQLAYLRGSGHPQIFWVFKDHPELADQPGPEHFVLESVPLQAYSVFQVKYDPGVWWVYAGFLLFLPGFFLAFFRPAQRWAVVLEPTPKGGFKGRLLGVSPRAREAFAATQERLLELLKKGTLS
jgi:cytochrome c biogenesis protein